MDSVIQMESIQVEMPPVDRAGFHSWEGDCSIADHKETLHSVLICWNLAPPLGINLTPRVDSRIIFKL
jgi:hypothetical protein